METLIILAQTKTAAAIEIIIFLVVAAVIGYLTAYFYYKGVYMKIIHSLEDKIKEHKGEIADLKEDVGELEKTLVSKEEEIAKLIKELKEKNEKG